MTTDGADPASPTARSPRGERYPDATDLADIARVMDALAICTLTGREKSVAMLLFSRQTSPRETDPADDDEWAGWTLVDTTELAHTFHEKTAGNMSRLLWGLVNKGVLCRGEGGAAYRYARLRMPCHWSAEVLDHSAARVRHSRVGAGRPPGGGVPRSSPQPLTHDDVEAALVGRPEPVRAGAWRFVDAFQQFYSAPEQQEVLVHGMTRLAAFKPTFVSQVADVIEHRNWTADELVALMRLTEAQHHPDFPWGYLKQSVTSRPALRVATPAAQEDTNEQERPASQPLPRKRSAARAAHRARATDASERRDHGAWNAFVESPGDDVDDDDDDDEPERIPARQRGARASVS